MAFSYNELVDRVDSYIRDQRARDTLLGRLLPESVFSPALWHWERRGVATGAAWGVSMAFAPLPLQTFFAALACVWRRGNLPIGIASCWVSVPGYQIIVWPLQWWVGALLLRALGCGSGASSTLIAESARAFSQGWNAGIAPLHEISLPLLAAEFLLGCLVTCALLGFFLKALILLIWRPKA